MTFGAVPAWLGWLILAAAGALAVRLFLVKLRPPRMLIPSLLLWRRVLDDAREQTLWERIRRAVSLVVTVLVALTLALAAVRPGRSAGTVVEVESVAVCRVGPAGVGTVRSADGPRLFSCERDALRRV